MSYQDFCPIITVIDAINTPHYPGYCMWFTQQSVQHDLDFAISDAFFPLTIYLYFSIQLMFVLHIYSAYGLRMKYR